MLNYLWGKKSTLGDKNESINPYWLILIAFTVVITLEYSTPSEYVFGYLYTGPILLANSRLSRSATIKVTFAAAVLTLLNLILPKAEAIQPATVANRCIAVMALIVTGWLSDRNRRYEDAIAKQTAQLQAQEKLAGIREDFVSTLTHDLKTPLLGALETLKSFQAGQFGAVTPAQKKILEMMARSHRSTLQLVQTLLDVYRNDAEGLQLQRSPLNLVSLAEQVISTLTDLAETRRVYVCLSYEASDSRRFLWVNADALQLERVFTNLLINAINHSPRGGKVEVVLAHHAGEQVVKVLDTGQGIAKQELPHLFERFYQGHSDRQASGAGLGLYLSRQIIEAHGGKIWAENHIPRGAIFGFRLSAGSPPRNLRL